MRGVWVRHERAEHLSRGHRQARQGQALQGKQEVQRRAVICRGPCLVQCGAWGLMMQLQP